MNREDPRYLRLAARAALYRANELRKQARGAIACMTPEWIEKYRDRLELRADRCETAAYRMLEVAWEMEGDE